MKKKKQEFFLGTAYCGITFTFITDVDKGRMLDTEICIQNTRGNQQTLCWINGDKIEELKQKLEQLIKDYAI